MARSRNIKPGFFTNEVLGEMSPLARLLFAGMWCHADREGRLEDRMKRLKPQILPYDDCDIDALAQCLHDARLVHRYVVDGKGYIQILAFKKHQNPHVKEQPSTIPAPDMHSACTGVAGLIPDSLNPIKPLSGKPDVAPRNSKAPYVNDAKNALEYLNKATGKGFELRNRNGELTASADKIIQRLKQGYTVTELREVVYLKSQQWGNDEKMSEYLRPSTLFSKEKFEQYIGELRGVKNG